MADIKAAVWLSWRLEPTPVELRDISRKARLIILKTSFYSLENSKLLWSATTSSINPSKLDQTLDAVINSLKNQLIKQKLIK